MNPKSIYIQQQQPNPLDLFATSALGSLGSQYIQQAQNARENQQIQDAFSSLSEDASPLQLLTTISGLNISPDKKEAIVQGFKSLEEQKRMAGQRSEQQKQASIVAEKLGLSPEDVEGLTPNQILNLQREKRISSRQVPRPVGLDEKDVKSIEDKPVLEPKTKTEVRKEKKEVPTEEFKEQVKADVKYNNELPELSKKLSEKELAAERLIKRNEEGATGSLFEKGLEKLGLIRFTSEGRREFASDIKTMLTDLRQILGSQFSTFEFGTILASYPSADYSKEANRAILNNLQTMLKLRRKEIDIAKQLKKENGGKIPYDFPNLVAEKLAEESQNEIKKIKENVKKINYEKYNIKPGEVLMYGPNGKPMKVPANKVAELEKLGATYEPTE